MCYLQETTFSCGHTQKSVLLACSFSAQLYRISDSGGPTFCLHGLQVVKSTTVQEACGANSKRFCNRIELKVLKPFFTRQTTIEQEFATYADRIRSIKTCLDTANRPVYNFRQIALEGWNAKEEQRRQDDLWNRILPALLDKAVAHFTHACNELTTAYVLTINEVSRQHFDRPLIDWDPPALETPLHPGSTIVDWLYRDSVVSHWEAAVYDGVYYATRRTLRHELLELETRALEACMDDVGWVLPGEQGARIALEQVKVSRLVQPVEMSGTGVRKAFVRRDIS